MHPIRFTVISADSTTLSKAVHNIDQFTLAPAERIQLLVKYDQVPENVSQIYVVTHDKFDGEAKYVIKLNLTLLNKSVINEYRDPKDFD